MATDLIFDFFGTLVQYKPGAFHTAPYERTHAYLLQQGFEITYEALRPHSPPFLMKWKREGSKPAANTTCTSWDGASSRRR